jgi:hypothetical protein
MGLYIDLVMTKRFSYFSFFKIISLAILIAISFYSCNKMVDVDQTQTLPITPYSQINADKKQKILNYLQHLSNVDSTIIGQHLGDIGSPYYTDNSAIDFLTDNYKKHPD